jgi:seryl-tRNA synthetase
MPISEIRRIRRLEAKVRRTKRLISKLVDFRNAADASVDEVLKLGAQITILDAELARAIHRDDGIRATQLIAELKPLIAERDAQHRAERRLDARIARVISKLQNQNEA